MVQYYKNRIWDILLCIALSTGLVFHIDSGFLLEDRLSASVPATMVLIAVVVLSLFFFASSKNMTMVGIVIGIVLLVIFLIYVRAAHPFTEEAANSLGITLTILILGTLLTFLATRTRAGIIVLFLIGNLILAGSCFLQFPVKTWAFLLFVFAACMMFLYRIYVISLQQVHTGKVRMQRYMTQTLGVCLTAFLVAAVAFFGVVRPLNPPTRELKLITRLENMQLLAVLGVSTVKELPDPELISSWISQGLFFSSEEGEEEGDGGSAGEEASTETNGEEENESAGQQLAAPVYYALHFFTLPWRILLLLLLIVGAFLARFLSRRSWRRKVQQLSPEGSVVNYYQYFLNHLGKAGFRKPDSYTLMEYARNMEHDLSTFTAGDDSCSFSHLTEIYTSVFYGMRTIGKKEVQLFEQFFENFDQNLRKEIGWPRYMLKVFWR